MFNARKVSILGAAFVLGSVLSASAADLGGLKDEPVAAPAAAGPSGWYIRADGGYAWYNKPGIEITDPFSAHDTNMDGAWSVGGGIGRYFGRGLRGDVTYEWRGATEFNAVSTSCCNTTTSFSTKSQVVLANIYYDFRPGERFTPYVGAGFGAAYVDSSGGSYPNNTCGCVPYDGKSQWNVAWALMAGASLRLDAHGPGRAHLDFGYRYLHLGDVVNGPNHYDWRAGPMVQDLNAHEFRVGLRYDLR